MTPSTAYPDYPAELMAANGEYGYDGYAVGADPNSPAPAGFTYLPRNRWLAAPFLLPIILCGISYAGGGLPFLTDVGMIVLMVLCALCLLRELVVFPFRYGIGGCILFGGVLIWFGYDYCKHWLGANYSVLPFEPWVVAKSAYFHCLFVFLMILGLRIPWGRTFEKLVEVVPEPKSRGAYFMLVMGTFLIGMLPFILFTNDPFYVAIWKAFWGGRSGEGAEFTVGRTGNLNYSWGGYVSQLADIGMMGAVLAAFCAVMVRLPIWQKIICWGIWALWLGIAFGTGTRGFVVFIALPVAMLVFLNYNVKASMLLRRISLRGYVASGAVGFCLLLLVQVQAQFRTAGFGGDAFKEVKVEELEGNEMFTTTLLGMKIIPEDKPPFYDRVPGEGAVRAMPQEIYKLVIGPIPRALWRSKPIDPVWAWYNAATTGGSATEGTTISGGAVGHPYVRYGPIGVVEFGLLYGWMMALAERALFRGLGKPMAIMLTMAFATFIFRSFRDLWWNNLYPVLVAVVVMWLFVKLANVFLGGSDEEQQHPMHPVPA